MSRRLREQLRVREGLLLDLGALVYELHRQGKRAPELLQAKAAELTVIDNEVRALDAALAGLPPPDPAPPPPPEPIDDPSTEEVEIAGWDDEPLDTSEEPVLAEHEEPRA
jgi:hypothetical protein